MNKFYRLLVDTDRHDLIEVSDYEAAEFNTPRLWFGKPLISPEEVAALSKVRLFVNSGKPSGDFLDNPLSWPICSTQFLGVLRSIAEGDFEVYEAPLYVKDSGAFVSGYHILNVTRLIPCIDLDRSDVKFKDDKKTEISKIYEFALQRDAIPADVQLFRSAEWIFTIFVREKLARALSQAKMTGIAFVECLPSTGDA